MCLTVNYCNCFLVFSERHYDRVNQLVQVGYKQLFKCGISWVFIWITAQQVRPLNKLFPPFPGSKVVDSKVFLFRINIPWSFLYTLLPTLLAGIETFMGNFNLYALSEKPGLIITPLIMKHSPKSLFFSSFLQRCVSLYYNLIHSYVFSFGERERISCSASQLAALYT